MDARMALSLVEGDEPVSTSMIGPPGDADVQLYGTIFLTEPDLRWELITKWYS